jgi:teichuronic acid exporter
MICGPRSPGPPLSIAASIRHNSLWLLAGSTGGRAMEFIIGIALARLLVPADFGLIVTVQVFTGFLGFIAGAGMGEALIQAKTVEPRDFQVVFTLQLAICGLIYAGLFALAPWVSVWFNDPIYTAMLRVSALSFLLRPFWVMPSSLLRREMRFKPEALSWFASLVAAGVSSIALAALGLGVWSLVYGGLVAGVMQVALLLYVTRWRPSLRFSREVTLALGAYGLRVSTIDVIAYLRSQTANLLVSHQLGPAPVGLFNKGLSLSELPAQSIAGAAQQTLFRALSAVQDDLPTSAGLFLRALTLVSLYAIPFYVGLAWVGPGLVVNLFGPHWAEAGLPLQILALSGLPRIITQLSAAANGAQNRLAQEIPIQLQTWALMALGAAAGLPWGITGVAVGLLPSLIYSAWRMYALAADALGLGWFDLWHALRPLLALNAALAGALLVGDLLLTWSGVERLAPVYLVAMTGLGGLVYGGLFLTTTDEALQGEAMRWRAGFARGLPRLG